MEACWAVEASLGTFCCRSAVLKLTQKTTESIFSGLISELETENWKRTALSLGFGESDSTFHDVKKNDYTVLSF